MKHISIYENSAMRILQFCYNFDSYHFMVKYEGCSKSSKTNSEKYFIYKICKKKNSTYLFFHRKIPSWNFSMETSLIEVL